MQMLLVEKEKPVLFPFQTSQGLMEEVYEAESH